MRASLAKKLTNTKRYSLAILFNLIITFINVNRWLNVKRLIMLMS
ncbi:hypothetical protein PCARR_a2415 [Pseudoalteromonas carrageenovora IAM 12662]|uniref:Transposase n=1 Tax=Pseudoalteromonas carrageenovora IAM 12662 TaxID=1314868 RepID=A0ABR9EJL3_PSEVC|nr:hypothetical protein [Pseudoalteromonas carrageenovora IAM 12662]